MDVGLAAIISGMTTPLVHAVQSAIHSIDLAKQTWCEVVWPESAVVFEAVNPHSYFVGRIGATLVLVVPHSERSIRSAVWRYGSLHKFIASLDGQDDAVGWSVINPGVMLNSLHPDDIELMLDEGATVGSLANDSLFAPHTRLHIEIDNGQSSE
jgi:hypothetical protein